ncbi:hypothetical protein EBT16_10760 [bacterium]|nr:hypothetical protein [bacterium]NBU71649.1 hypothetical protein [Bacteroidota bacterium]
MGQTKSETTEGHGIFIGSVFGVFTVIFVVFVTSMFCSRSKIDPETTYQVFDVTDGTGKTYRNLNLIGDNVFVDRHGNQYSFHGNYTAMTRKVSGEQLLKDTGIEKESQ